MGKQLAADFAKAFHEAGGHSVLSYSNLIRFAALMCVIVAFIGSINHFLSAEERESDGFMVRLASRTTRLFIGLTLFICFLTTKGS